MTRRVVVVGATGTIGRSLCAALSGRGDLVVVFSRDPQRARQQLPEVTAWLRWQPEELSAEAAGELRAADAVVYLAGAPLFDGRCHGRADIEAETHARIGGISRLVAGMAGAAPAVFIAASSVGYYGYSRFTDADYDETSPAGNDWWGRSSEAIEAAALAAVDSGSRTVLLRSGYVLTPATIQAQVTRFSRHLGGWIGTGRGWMPWIHIADEVGIVLAALDDPSIDGALNATSPQPVRARSFARAVGNAVGRHAWLAVPTPMVRMGLGAVTDILVRGKRVLPTKALAAGQEFQHASLDGALRDLLAR